MSRLVLSRPGPAIGLLLPVLLAGGIVAAALAYTLYLGRYVGNGPNRIYSVAEVASGIQTHPDQWSGRTVFVRGLEVGISSEEMQRQHQVLFAIIASEVLFGPNQKTTAGVIPTMTGTLPGVVGVLSSQQTTYSLPPLATVPVVGPWLRQHLVPLSAKDTLFAVHLARPAPGCTPYDRPSRQPRPTCAYGSFAVAHVQ